jgi:hypothetical protein
MEEGSRPLPCAALIPDCAGSLEISDLESWISSGCQTLGILRLELGGDTSIFTWVWGWTWEAPEFNGVILYSSASSSDGPIPHKVGGFLLFRDVPPPHSLSIWKSFLLSDLPPPAAVLLYLTSRKVRTSGSFPFKKCFFRVAEPGMRPTSSYVPPGL